MVRTTASVLVDKLYYPEPGSPTDHIIIMGTRIPVAELQKTSYINNDRVSEYTTDYINDGKFVDNPIVTIGTLESTGKNVYLVKSGRHRGIAVQKSEHKRIEVTLEEDRSVEDLFGTVMKSNKQRTLNPEEKGSLYNFMNKKLGMTIDEITSKCGVYKRTVTNAIEQFVAFENEYSLYSDEKKSLISIKGFNRMVVRHPRKVRDEWADKAVELGEKITSETPLAVGRERHREKAKGNIYTHVEMFEKMTKSPKKIKRQKFAYRRPKTDDEINCFDLMERMSANPKNQMSVADIMWWILVRWYKGNEGQKYLKGHDKIYWSAIKNGDEGVN